MIETSLGYVRTRLNHFLAQAMSAGGQDIAEQDIVELSRLDGEDGSQADEKVVIQLLRVEKVTTPHQARNGQVSGGRQLVVGQPLYLNLYVLVAANFSQSNYSQALAYLSQVVEFFQDHGVFDRHNSPDLPAKVDKLCFEIDNVGPHDLSSIWGMIGAKYMPSVIYQVRLLALGGDVKGQSTSLSQPADPQTGQR